MDRLNRWAPLALGILRIVAALLFIEHGTQKLFNLPAGEHGGVGFQMSLIGLAGVLETFGGLLLLIGLFTRPTAFILSGMMAVAYWMAHFKPDNPFPVNNGGDAAILFCFVFLYIVFAGPGALSADDQMGRRRL
ncbi:MAG TPA: DoxX family protein [Caulobacteraceae bacterium]|nr:DoxX family protein [Caulobacteraceae bacterium]